LHFANTYMADLKFCAHYPFSDEAKAYVKQKNMQIGEEALKGAKERLAQGLREGEIKTASTSLQSELEMQVQYYAASRAILAAWGNNYAKRRMAVAESKAASRYLSSSHERNAGYVKKVASLFGMEFLEDEKDAQKFYLPFYHYLLYTPRDIHFKLSNMELKNGLVKVTQRQKERILEEAIRKRLEDSHLPKMKNPPEEIKKIIMQLQPLLPKEVIEPIKIEKKDFPPCILQMVDNLTSSINVPHSGRLALAIYLIKAGLTNEQINAIFSHAPDYSKETTLYQIEYIRKKEYSMPSCNTMDTYGICMAECRCNNPARYREAIHGKYAKLSMEKRGASSRGDG